MPEDKISAAVISETAEEPRRHFPKPYYCARSAQTIKRERRTQSNLKRTKNSRRSVSLVDSRDTVNKNREFGNVRSASASADADKCGSTSSFSIVKGEDSPNFRGGEGAAILKQIKGNVVNSHYSKGEDDSGFTTPTATDERVNNKHYVCPGAPKKTVAVFRIKNRDLRSVARRLNFDALATWESTDTEVVEVRNHSIG